MISLSKIVKKDRCPFIANYFLLITGCTSFAQYRVTCSACGIRSISKDVKTLLNDFNCFVTSKKRMASACKHLSSWSGTTFNFEEAFLRSLADKCLGTVHIYYVSTFRGGKGVRKWKFSLHSVLKICLLRRGVGAKHMLRNI